MGRKHTKLHGLGFGDVVTITSPRAGLVGIRGIVTGIASGPELVPYYRVRIHTQGFSATSPWFLRDELRKADE